MNRGMDNLRKSGHMKEIINKMFDFECEVVDVEKEISSYPTMIETVFNFKDLSFQLFLDTPDETFIVVA